MKKFRDIAEQLVDAYCWWRKIDRHFIHVTYPLVVATTFSFCPTQVRPDIDRWCSDVLADQFRFDGLDRFVFKHKTGMAMFRMTWSADVAKMQELQRAMRSALTETAAQVTTIISRRTAAGLAE